MKIAFINKYQNKVYRGAETFVYELSKRLAINHDVDILTTQVPLKILRKKYDVLIPTNGRFQVVLVRIISWLTGAKVIVSGQSGIGWDDKVNLYSFPDAFIALSTKALNWAKKINPFVKSVYIPNGVDLNKFKMNNLQFTNKNKKAKTVLTVGAFTEQKRLNLAIDAVSRLSNVNLIIAGGGGDLKQKITDYGLKILGEDRFKVLSVPFEKMPEVYRSGDIFTLPSKSSESFGNVLVEAMASGLPVVATDDAIRREIVGDAGILVDPENIDAYAGAIKKALNSDLSKKAAIQAKKYNWDIIASQYEKLLENL